MLEIFTVVTAQLAWSAFCVWFGTWLERRAVERRKRTALGQVDVVQSMFDKRRGGEGDARIVGA